MYPSRTPPRIGTDVEPIARRSVRLALLVCMTLLGLGGCTRSSQSSSSTSSTSTATSEQGPIHEVELTSGRLEPGPSMVDLPAGQTLTLVLTSDVPVTVHAHGFEVDLQVPATSTTRIPLRASVPGVYEVELHDPELLVLSVAVR